MEPMATLVGANFFVYFTITGDADRVRCKLCNKSLMANRRFNLKQHLKQTHKIEVSSNPKAGRKSRKSRHSSEVIPTTSSEIDENKAEDDIADNFFDMNNDSVDSNDDEALPSDVEVKTLPVQKIRLKGDTTDEVEEQGVSYEIENIDDNNAETATKNISKPSLARETFAEPIPLPKLIRFKRAFSNDPLNEPLRLPKKISTFEPHLKMKNNKEKIKGGDDPLDESNSSNNDHFEQWSKKKIRLLEIELLEMRNYTHKLDLFEREQKLQVASSKFTRDIRGNQ